MDQVSRYIGDQSLGASRAEGGAVTGQLLTAEQLAKRWQVPTSHVYRLAREGQIPTVELGRYRRWRLDVIEAFERGPQPPKDRRAA